MRIVVPNDARLVRVEELEEVAVCDFVARTKKQKSEQSQ